MGIYYHFVAEAKIEGAWKCMGWQMLDSQGRSRPCYNCSINKHDLEFELTEIVEQSTLTFDELAEGTKATILEGYTHIDGIDMKGNKIKLEDNEIKNFLKSRNYYQITEDGVRKLGNFIEQNRELNRLLISLHEQMDNLRRIYNYEIEIEDIRVIIDVDC